MKLHSAVSVSFVLLAACILCVMTARTSWIGEKVRAARVGTGRGSTPPLVRPNRDGRPLLLLLGDSRISRWPQDSRETKWLSYNRGIGGETLQGLMDRFVTEVQQLRPQAVLVSTGINDIVGISFMPPAEADAAAELLTSRFFALSAQASTENVALYITTIIPPARPSLLRRLAWSDRTVDLVEAVNARLRAHSWPQSTRLVDLGKAFHLDADQHLSDAYRLDTLHLNKLGYAAVQSSVATLLD